MLGTVMMQEQRRDVGAKRDQGEQIGEVDRNHDFKLDEGEHI